MINFSRNVKFLRKKRGLTQDELSSEIKVTRGMLTSYETGRTTPTIATLIELSTFFRTSIDDLLKKDLQNQAVTSINPVSPTNDCKEKLDKALNKIEYLKTVIGAKNQLIEALERNVESL